MYIMVSYVKQNNKQHSRQLLGSLNSRLPRIPLPSLLADSVNKNMTNKQQQDT